MTSRSASNSALIPRTARNDPNRSYRLPRSPRPGFGSTSQIAFSALCSWLKSPGGAKPKEDNAQHRRRDTRAAPVRVLRGGLDGDGHGLADGAFDLLGQPALCRLSAENQAGGGEGQHNHRRDGEDGVKGQGGAELKSPGLVPLQPRLLQQSHESAHFSTCGDGPSTTSLLQVWGVCYHPPSISPGDNVLCGGAVPSTCQGLSLCLCQDR